ncbi:putative major facilitator superfamily transporter, partial [Aureobasidium melanogenum]
MGRLFRSRKNKSSGGPSTVSLENHEHTDESMSKNETLAAVREASVDKDAVSKLEGDGSAVIPGAEDESKYPTGPKLWLLVLGLCLAIWVIALDNSIIATAIPKITTQWPDALNDVGWIGSSYLLTTTSLQPSFGKVYTYFDVKWTYLSALIIFEVGSVICAAATSSTMLIVGRAVAGVGAAALFSGGMTIIGFIAPLRKRAIYIASLSSMFGIASVVGPLLGGVFTDHATWRWCFWINLPFGGIGLVTVFFFFENPKRRHANMTFKEKIRQIDLLGALLLICAIVCLLLALQWGGTTYPWSDSKVWGCLLGFGLLISIFIALQIKLGDRATLPPRILVKNRTVLVSALYRHNGGSRTGGVVGHQS